MSLRVKTDVPEQASGVTDLVARLVDGLGQLLAQHVELARLELVEESRSLGRTLGTPILQETTAAVRESARALQVDGHREVGGVH